MSTISPPRGALSHMVDALREDNRLTLLEALRSDPRCDSAPSSPLRLALRFSSPHLRHTLVQTVAATHKTTLKRANRTPHEEEAEIVRQWNDELASSARSVVGVDLLSASSCEADVIVYILRGGGFDLPALSAAALHRRRTIADSHVVRKQSPQQLQCLSAVGETLFRFLFVPRITEMERKFLGDLGVVDNCDTDNQSLAVDSVRGSGTGVLTSFESLPIDLIPLDDDLWSLELAGGTSWRFAADGDREARQWGEGHSSVGTQGYGNGRKVFDAPVAACFRHSEVEGCEADVADIVARSLIKLQILNGALVDESNRSDITNRESTRAGGENGTSRGDSKKQNLRGAIPRVQGLGPLATAVIDRMMTLRLEEEKMDIFREEEMQAEVDAEEIENRRAGAKNRILQDSAEIDDVIKDGEDVEIRASPLRPPQSSVSSFPENTSSSSSSSFGALSSIDALLVIDRKIDLVTPMLTPLTYEGLIDDVLQIQTGGCVLVQRSLVEPKDDENIPSQTLHRMEHRPDSKDDTVVLLSLNDSDPLYTEVRDKHVEIFGSFLQNQAKALKESHSQFTNKETARDLTEIHQFVKQIPVFTRNLRSLTNHIHIAELVKRAAEASSFRQRWQTERSMLESEPCYEVLEDLIASGEPPYRWLRLLCLQSLTSNGIKATRYDSLRKEIVQTYGFEFMLVLNDLEKSGFLRKRETFWMDSMTTSYSTLRKALNLIHADVDPSKPDDPSYVSSGYAPMTVRWVQAAMRGYTGLDEAMRELPAAGGVGTGSGGGGGGRWVDIEQQWPPESLLDAMKRPRAPSLGSLAKNRVDVATNSTSTGGSAGKKPVLLVWFVGGVTYMEIAALRFLSKRSSFPYSIVCCTTEIVNGGTLLQSLSC